MNQKLLFFDIDGTLLAGGIPGYIPESAIESLKKAQENGHFIFINSGRTYHFMPDLIKEFPFDGYICGCGTDIILHDKNIFHNEIPKDIRFDMVKVLEKTKVQAAFEGKHSCFFDERDDLFPPIASIRDAYSSSKTANPALTFDDPELDYDKFVIFYDENSDVDLFKELTDEGFDYIQREEMDGYGFAEIVPKGCSKASGIDVVVNHLGLSLDDCYVFGDSTNDLSMLSHVKNSIAMGNSYPEVLDITSYVTTPIDRDGIKVAMKHFGLI